MADRSHKSGVLHAPGTVHVPHRPRLSNSILAIFLVGVVMLAPLPLASNRPQLWTFWTFLLGLTGACYFFFATLNNQKSRFPLQKLAFPGVVFAIFCFYLIFQLIPLPWSPASLSQLGTVQIVSDTVSVNHGATWLMLLRWLGYGLFFFLFAQVSVNHSRAHVILQLIFLAVVGYAALGLFLLTQWDDTLLGEEKWAYQGFATGSFVNRNSFATFLAMALPAGIALMFRKLQTEVSAAGKTAGIALIAAGTLIIAAALFATGSRMGAFAGTIGIALTLFLAVWKSRFSVWLVFGLCVVVIMTGLIFLLTYGENLLDRLMFTEIDRDTRWLVFSQTLDAIRQRPWLGYGGGSFQWAFPVFSFPPLSPERMWDKAHSTYLQLWFEMGWIFGTLPLLLGVIAAWREMGRILSSSYNWYIPLAGFGALIVATIHSTVDFSLEIPANAYLLLALSALAVSGNRSKLPPPISARRGSES